MARTGKIARLTIGTRHQLNCALRDGVPAKEILAKFNEDERVKRILKQYFGGIPISEQNLSDWRQGGYQEWLRNQSACETVDRLREESAELKAAAPKIDVTQCLATKLAVELANIAEGLLAEAASPKERWERLRELLPHLAQLRRADQRAEVLAMKRFEFENNWISLDSDDPVPQSAFSSPRIKPNQGKSS